jgi:protocatechuate 3,4-dioxygenase, alpha subunit
VVSVPGLCNDATDVFDHVLAGAGTFGERIAIEGVVHDGLEQPIADALLEIWQANAHGRYHHPLDTSGRELDPAFTGYGRAATDGKGAFAFRSIKPGPVPGPAGSIQAPHLNLVLGARGMTRHAFTRIYFEGDARLAEDPILALVPEHRRPTLLARASGQRDGATLYRFDIHLQGEDETVFFEL